MAKKSFTATSRRRFVVLGCLLLRLVFRGAVGAATAATAVVSKQGDTVILGANESILATPLVASNHQRQEKKPRADSNKMNEDVAGADKDDNAVSPASKDAPGHPKNQELTANPGRSEDSAEPANDGEKGTALRSGGPEALFKMQKQRQANENDKNEAKLKELLRDGHLKLLLQQNLDKTFAKMVRAHVVTDLADDLLETVTEEALLAAATKYLNQQASGLEEAEAKILRNVQRHIDNDLNEGLLPVALIFTQAKQRYRDAVFEFAVSLVPAVRKAAYKEQQQQQQQEAKEEPRSIESLVTHETLRNCQIVDLLGKTFQEDVTAKVQGRLWELRFGTRRDQMQLTMEKHLEKLAKVDFKETRKRILWVVQDHVDEKLAKTKISADLIFLHAKYKYRDEVRDYENIIVNEIRETFRAARQAQQEAEEKQRAQRQQELQERMRQYDLERQERQRQEEKQRAQRQQELQERMRQYDLELQERMRQYDLERQERMRQYDLERQERQRQEEEKKRKARQGAWVNAAVLVFFVSVGAVGKASDYLYEREARARVAAFRRQQQ